VKDESELEDSDDAWGPRTAVEVGRHFACLSSADLGTKVEDSRKGRTTTPWYGLSLTSSSAAPAPAEEEDAAVAVMLGDCCDSGCGG
jgi:hypothetical protein